MTSAGTPRPCPPSAVADQIIPWGEVQEGDLVLHEESLKVVESIKPGPSEHYRDVTFTEHDPAIGDIVRACDLTAVRRYTEGN